MMSPQLSDFRYVALTADGLAVRGRLDAGSFDEAKNALVARGWLPMEVTLSRRLRAHGRSLPAADLAVGLRMLADLLAAGLPMGRALDVFREIAPDAWQRAIDPLRAAVREGKSLATALGESPVRIPAIVIGMARTGEAGDGIADAMRRAATYSENVAATRAAIRSALAYPIVVAITGSLCIAVMLGAVLPRFALMLADLGQALPATTQLVLQFADIARTSFLPVVLVTTAMMIALQQRLRTPAGRRGFHRALLAVPLVGTTRWSASTSRVTTALSAVVASGVPIVAGLRLAAQAAADAEIEARLHDALVRIKAGESLASALKAENAVTPLTVRLIHAGEETGRLPDMLASAGVMEQERVSRTLQVGIRALEPIMIVTFAALVGLVAVALLQAVYAVRPM